MKVYKGCQLYKGLTIALPAIIAASLLAACSGSPGGESDGGTTVPASDGSVYDASRPDTGIGFDVAITPPAPPVFTDWVCPEGWAATPGFTDENGVENPPEGVDTTRRPSRSTMTEVAPRYANLIREGSAPGWTMNSYFRASIVPE